VPQRLKHIFELILYSVSQTFCQVPQSLNDLLVSFNRDRQDIPVAYRSIAHAHAILFIGSNLLQPYVDNDCVLRLIAAEILASAGFASRIVFLPCMRDISPHAFWQALCSS
jgi:hypothetical protein